MTLDTQDIELINSIIAINSSKEILTVKEAALFLGVSTDQVYALRKEGKITSYKPDGKPYFSRSDLIKYALSNPRKSIEELEYKSANRKKKS